MDTNIYCTDLNGSECYIVLERQSITRYVIKFRSDICITAHAYMIIITRRQWMPRGFLLNQYQLVSRTNFSDKFVWTCVYTTWYNYRNNTTTNTLIYDLAHGIMVIARLTWAYIYHFAHLLQLYNWLNRSQWFTAGFGVFVFNYFCGFDICNIDPPRGWCIILTGKPEISYWILQTCLFIVPFDLWLFSSANDYESQSLSLIYTVILYE